MDIEKELKKLKENKEEFKRESRKRTREMNKTARELGFPRGIKQMIEEGEI